MGENYTCSICGYETDILTVGDIRVGCPHCGRKDGFSKYDDSTLDPIMRALGED